MDNNAPLKIIVERLEDDLPIPSKATEGSAGLDLFAAVHEQAPIDLDPGERCLVPTGIKLMIPKGFEGQIRPRSGLAIKHGITVLNAPGTIDSDYRGQISVILINLANQPFRITRGTKIAQIIFSTVTDAVLIDGLMDETSRGSGGFGSTGL